MTEPFLHMNAIHDQTGPDVPPVQRCTLESLSEGVIATPLQEAYHIGEVVTLSCPEGKQLSGEEEVSCNPSQQFSPDPARARCITGVCAKPLAASSCSAPLRAVVYLAVH